MPLNIKEKKINKQFSRVIKKEKLNKIDILWSANNKNKFRNINRFKQFLCPNYLQY